MRNVLLTVFFMFCLTATSGIAAAQQNQTPENKDKNAAEKTADKAKEVGQEVGDKAGDVKDKTVKGVKKTGHKTKEVAGETADKADDVKDKTVDATKNPQPATLADLTTLTSQLKADSDTLAKAYAALRAAPLK